MLNENQNALYTDEEEERFSRNILKQINYFVYVDGTWNEILRFS